MEKLPKHENVEIPELSAEAGVREVVDRTWHLLEKQPTVIIAFSSLGSNVGKSWLANSIRHELEAREIYCFIVHGYNDLNRHRVDHSQNEFRRQPFVAGKTVVIFDQFDVGPPYPSEHHEKLKAGLNRLLSKNMNSIGYSVQGVDIWVGLYRPDRPLGSNNRLMGDLIIRNDNAKDK